MGCTTKFVCHTKTSLSQCSEHERLSLLFGALDRTTCRSVKLTKSSNGITLKLRTTEVTDKIFKWNYVESTPGALRPWQMTTSIVSAQNLTSLSHQATQKKENSVHLNSPNDNGLTLKRRVVLLTPGYIVFLNNSLVTSLCSVVLVTFHHFSFHGFKKESYFCVVLFFFCSASTNWVTWFRILTVSGYLKEEEQKVNCQLWLGF